MNISIIVSNLVREHGTRNPMEIAMGLDILCFVEDLGSINGYYMAAFNVRTIHVNKNLSPMRQNVACAHELGHVILHPCLNSCLIRITSFAGINKFERQANEFASYLVMPDDMLQEFHNCDIDEIAKICDIPASILNERLSYYN